MPELVVIPSCSISEDGMAYLELILVGLLLVGCIIGAYAGTRSIVDLLARERLGRG